jgi:hypothetical protein
MYDRTPSAVQHSTKQQCINARHNTHAAQPTQQHYARELKENIDSKMRCHMYSDSMRQGKLSLLLLHVLAEGKHQQWLLVVSLECAQQLGQVFLQKHQRQRTM